MLVGFGTMRGMAVDIAELTRTLRRRPFETVRVHVSDGSHYDIRHPDQAIVTKRELYVGVSPIENHAYLKVDTISNMHITRLEFIDH